MSKRQPAPAEPTPAPHTEPPRSSKIRPTHLERLAVVYVRQSTPHQVLHHRESRERQYALADHARQLGWPPERILVIDEDQGHSGKSAEGRLGFQRLLLEVNLDHVGLILGLEMNRLARSSKDWQQLFEVCAIFNTLLADEEGIYDPNDPNDRLVLGLKGILSEVELHTMRVRLHRGILHKAQRGELFSGVPIGYVRDAQGQVQLDPDEQVRALVRMVFDKFDELGSVAAVFRYLVGQGLRMGVRLTCGPHRGQLEWHPINRSTLASMLHHPIYAGAYVYGRRHSDPKRQAQGRSHNHRLLPPEQWKVLLRDRLPAYIRWEQFLANQQRLHDNQARAHTPGAPRAGSCLLAGLIRCQPCGDRLHSQYRAEAGRKGAGYYNCRRVTWDPDAPFPRAFVQASVVDALVSEQLLRALEPAALEVSLRAADDLQRERERLEQVWQQRLERARYDGERAFRQYNAAEPENRLVVRTLEQRWEEALRQQRQLEEEHARFVHEQPLPLRPRERQRIAALARDLPGVWQASSTTVQDRKEILRLVIDRVEVAVHEQTAVLPVTIHWVGGHVSTHPVRRSVGSYSRLNDWAQLRQRVLELREQARTAGEIAAVLNREGFHPVRFEGQFSSKMVSSLLLRLGEKTLDMQQPRRRLLGAHEWTLPQLANKLPVNPSTLRLWRRVGWVQSRRLPGAANRWLLWADNDEIDRLRRLRDCPHISVSRHGGYPPELTTPKPRPGESEEQR